MNFVEIKELHPKLFNRLSVGNPKKDKLAVKIEAAIKQKLGSIALKVV
jgi:hypothetical protein